MKVTQAVFADLTMEEQVHTRSWECPQFMTSKEGETSELNCANNLNEPGNQDSPRAFKKARNLSATWDLTHRTVRVTLCCLKPWVYDYLFWQHKTNASENLLTCKFSVLIPDLLNLLEPEASRGCGGEGEGSSWGLFYPLCRWFWHAKVWELLLHSDRIPRC